MAGPSLNMVLSTLKACVISNPDGVDEDRLNSEFRQLMGCNIPWKDLGFKNLHDLIVSSSSLQVVTKGGRRLVVVETSGAQHLSEMIKKQKKPSSSRKRTPRLTHFFQKNFNSYKPPGMFGRGNSNSGKKPPFKKVDCIERNNNLTVKPPPSNKEVHHNTNCRPAGDSSSSGHSSPTFAPIELKPILKQTKTEESKNQQKTSSKTKQKVTLLPLPENISLPTKPTKSPLLPLPEKTVPNSKKDKSKKPDSPKTKSPVSLSPSIQSSTQTKSSTFKPSGPFSPTIPATIGPQNLLNMSVPDLIPREPLVFFSPKYLQNTFVPANLVPPKPMKPGSYRGGRRKFSPRSKLMSIKDNSKPTKGSLTAQFINLIKTQEWPDPEYRLLPRVAPNKIEVYGCTVRGCYSLDNNETLLNYDYSTIPNEYPDMIACKEAVSQKAYEDMSNKIKEASNYVPVTSNPDVIVNRVLDIVSAFPNGLWAYKVESNYKNEYGERLPSRWVDLIKETDCLAAEKLADFSHVIRRVVKVEGGVSGLDMCLAELEYPSTETWDIYVTKIVSSSEVWFRFVGSNYSDWLDEVTKDMCDYYEDWTSYVCPSPVLDHFYVYLSIHGAVRVKVISLDNPATAKVMHIDHGDIEEVPRDHLCDLDPSFCKLPPQAVCCKMYDLEEYSNNKLCTAFLMDKIEGIVLVAEIVQTEPLVLIMFDTSSDDPINLNQEVVNQLRTDITTPPSLPQELNVVQEGELTSIWRTGEIYLQLPNDGLTYLSLQLNSLQDVSAEYYLTLPEDVLPDVLYLVQVDGQWLRATVLPPARAINNMVELLLVDTGDIKTSLYTELVPLSLMFMVLCEIPRQALRVRLSNVNIYEETVEKLQNLISPPCKAIIKVISLGQVPEVEIYIRESKGLISINHTICLEENLSNKVNSMALTYNSDFCTIKQALTPECEEFFEVFVVSVSNPSNFIVIPRKFIKELSDLQNRLQGYYNSVDHATLRLRNFSIGQACAVQHTDSQWYRGLIEQVIDRSMSQLMIRFCDFGNFAMISADRLLALHQNFLNLPALGFNASIADIQPISGDWEFVDCIRAQKLMLEKNLVTVIKSKIVNEEHISLKLQVFDTTGDNDCDIGNILVEELRASYS